MSWKTVDFQESIVSGNPESPTGLFHYTFGVEGGDGPFLGVTLKLPTYYSVEEFDFEEILNGDVYNHSMKGVLPVFYVTDAEEVCYRWAPIGHDRFVTMRLPEYWEDDPRKMQPPATVNLIVKQMSTPEYETLVAFDQAGPREEWMDVEFVEWRTSAK